jgi:hypothetical protein
MRIQLAEGLYKGKRGLKLPQHFFISTRQYLRRKEDGTVLGIYLQTSDCVHVIPVYLWSSQLEPAIFLAPLREQPRRLILRAGNDT